MKTMLTFEEWWAYEAKRRKERPYTPETYLEHFWTCPHNVKHERGPCWECDSQGRSFEKTILRRG